jgi:hypothetical protein
MFRFFVTPLGFPIQDISELHPVTLEALLERCWNRRFNAGFPLGHPDHRSDVPGRPDALLAPTFIAQPRMPPRAGNIDVPALAAAILAVRWHQLIYAYMIENTRVLDVFRKVADSCLHGERLGALSPQSQRWLWTTEELFLRDPPSFSISTITSSVRPSSAATRGNAYQRFYGMGLNAVDGNKPSFPVAEHANTDFVMAFDELLYEIWQGRQNFANAAGARPTDDAKIAELATRLCHMLRSRRTNGTLSREEFVAVSTMSWFHAMLVDPAHPIIVDLRADANSPEERLFKIAQRVGVPAHGLSKSYFEVAEPLSRILVAIEVETYNNVAAVPALYTPAPGGPSADTDTIITHWSLIRGRDVKAKKLLAA